MGLFIDANEKEFKLELEFMIIFLPECERI